jgi:hypothetical protein
MIKRDFSDLFPGRSRCNINYKLVTIDMQKTSGIFNHCKKSCEVNINSCNKLERSQKYISEGTSIFTGTGEKQTQ